MRPLPSSRLAAACAFVAGILWLAVWAHQLAAHGRTEVNEMRLVAGATWMDSGKLLALAPLLLVPAALHLRARAPGRASRALYGIVAALLPLFALAALLQFAFFPWGSYARTFEMMPAAQAAGLAQSLMSLALAALFLAAGIPTARARGAPVWAVGAPVVGMLFAFWLTIASWVPAVAWLVVAAWLAWESRPSRQSSAGQ